MGVIRAGLDVVKKALPQSFTWKAPEDVPIPSEETDEEEDQEQHDEDDLVDTVQAQTPVRRNLVSDSMLLMAAFSHQLRVYSRVHS